MIVYPDAPSNGSAHNMFVILPLEGSHVPPAGNTSIPNGFRKTVQDCLLNHMYSPVSRGTTYVSVLLWTWPRQDSSTGLHSFICEVIICQNHTHIYKADTQTTFRYFWWSLNNVKRKQIISPEMEIDQCLVP